MYVLGLIGIFLWSLIINALAPTFGGQKDSVQALKTAAYAATAAWVGGVGQLDALDRLADRARGRGLQHLPALSRAAAHDEGARRPGRRLHGGRPSSSRSSCPGSSGRSSAASWAAACGAAVTADRGSRSTTAASRKAAPAPRSRSGPSRWRTAGKQVEASAQQNQGAPSAAAIGALVGAAVGGKARRRRAAGRPAQGLTCRRRSAACRARDCPPSAMPPWVSRSSEANADYGDGAGRNLRLEINDTGGAQGMLALASWANVESEKQWDGGYERNYRADGRMVHERWDSNGQQRRVQRDRRATVSPSRSPGRPRAWTN